jgi:hypothetical protein
VRLYSDGIKLINNPLANVAPPTAKKIRQRPNTKIKKEIIKFFFIYRVQIERKDKGIEVPLLADEIKQSFHNISAFYLISRPNLRR